MIFGKSKDKIAISVDEGALCLAWMTETKDSGRSIRAVTHKEVQADDAGAITDAVLNARKEWDVKKASGIFCIPSGMVTTKNIEIPSLDPKEIRSIIDLQAGRHTPLSREEILIGYISIGVFQRNYTKVLLIIANRSTIKARVEAVEAVGVPVEKVVFSPECVAQFYVQAMGVSEKDAVGLIAVQRTSTDFIVVCNSTIATCRNIPLGISQLQTDPQEAPQRFLEELTSSLEAYQNEDINEVPKRYIVTSDNNAVAALIPKLEEGFHSAIETAAYDKKINAVQGVQDALSGEFSGVPFMNEIAALTVPLADVQIDLMPEEILVQRSIQDKGRQVILSGVYGIVLLLIVCGVFLSKVYFQTAYLSKMKEVYLKKHRLVVALDKVAHRTRVIKDFMQTRLVGLDVLKEIYSLVPNEIYFQNIFLDENGIVNIQGISESMSRVFDLVSDLEDSNLFKSVKTRSTVAKKDRGKDAAAFDIICQLESTEGDLVSEVMAEEEQAQTE